VKAYLKNGSDGLRPALDDAEIASIVERYMPLVLKLVDRTWISSRVGITRDDLISAGSYGLLLAARRFDPARGVGFGVFARAHIHGALMREINLASKAAGAGSQDSFVDPAEVEPDSLPDEQAASAADSTENAELRELMEYVLNEDERLVLALYYFEELTLAEIAAVVGGSESSAARTIKGALATLKAAMKGEKVR
jgi:RNA polymerase sigma factor for flagellar operon FliA